MKDFGGVPIFDERFRTILQDPGVLRFWQDRLRKLSYDPYFRQITEEVERTRKKLGPEAPILILDIHDTDNTFRGPTPDQNRPRGGYSGSGWQMPLMILSDQDHRTTAPIGGKEGIRKVQKILLESLSECGCLDPYLENTGFTLNDPYKGGWVTQFFGLPDMNPELRPGDPLRELKKRISTLVPIAAIQVELSREAVYKTGTNRTVDPEKVQKLARSFSQPLERMSQEFSLSSDSF